MFLYENRSDKLSFEAHHKTRERDYWLSKLSGEHEKSVFPYDWKRTGQERRMETVTFNLAGDIYSRLSMLSNNSDLRLYIILAAAVVELLRRYTGSDDITLGSPIEKQEVEGEFINTVLVIRNQLEEDLTFKELLLQVSDTIIEANENVNYPLETLIYQLNLPFSPGDFPLFDVALLLSGIHDKEDIRHVPVNVMFSFISNPAEGYLEGVLEYNSALYEPGTIERIINHLVRLLEKALADVNIKLADIDILLPEEKKYLLEDFNDTVTDYPVDRTIHELFETEVERVPDRIAVIGKRQSLGVGGRENFSYGWLNRQANRLARVLRARGVQADTIVGIMLGPSLAMIVGILGILKAGGAYLPIDRDYPGNRVVSMLEDCRSSLLVTEEDLSALSAVDVEVIPWDDLPAVDGTDGDGASVENSGPVNRSSHLAYVMFTSGSSGKPKGTLTSHYNVVRVVKNTNYIEIEPGDRILQLSNFAFDGSVFGIYGALLNGAVLVEVEKQQAFGLDELADIIKREQVTVFFVTTALFNALVETHIESLQGIGKVLFGGERVSVEHTKKALEELGTGKIIHMYGPTETTVYTTYYPVDGIDERLGTIPIGKPLANTTVYILDRRLQPVPLGVNGEIYIGGKGVARGYLRRDRLTAESFLQDPFREGERMYKTGDLARWLPDGNIEFVGRIDDQVKIRGFRIEPGEIENQLLLHGGVGEAVVVVGKAETGDKFLCAYVVPASAGAAVNASSDQAAEMLKPSGLREYLSEYLPDYMIPSYFVMLEDFPLNPNGKVDRKALPDPETGASGEMVDYTPPRDEIEKKLVEIWSEVLGIEQSKIGIDFDFFEFGGHSLKATTVISNIYKEMNVKVPLEEIFVMPSIRGLGEYIKKARKGTDVSMEAAPGKEYYPLSSQQKRLDFIQRLFLPGNKVAANPVQEKIMKTLNDHRRQVNQTPLKGLNAKNKYRKILLTGATGFLGAHLAVELLNITRAGLYLLVRGKSKEDCTRRLERKFTYYFGRDFYHEHRERLQVVPGDLTGDRAGIDDVRYKSLSETIDAVIHAAATVKHFGHYADFYQTNVLGTEKLLQFSMTGKQKDFHYISTLSVCSGDVEGKEYMVYTEFSEDMGQQHKNAYVESKFEAEKKIYATRKQGLNASIYRLGNLVFHSQTGKFQENIEDNAFYANIKAFITLGAVTDNLRLSDFTFVDQAARTIVLLMMRKNLLNRNHHIVNRHAFEWKDMEQALENAGIKIQFLRPALFFDYLVEQLEERSQRRNVERLLLHLGFFEKERKNRTVNSVAAHRTQNVLEKLDFQWPEITDGHIEKMIAHCQKVGFLEP